VMSHQMAQVSASHERVRRTAGAVLIRNGAVTSSIRSQISAVTTLAAAWSGPGRTFACSTLILGRCMLSWHFSPRELALRSYPVIPIIPRLDGGRRSRAKAGWHTGTVVVYASARKSPTHVVMLGFPTAPHGPRTRRHGGKDYADPASRLGVRRMEANAMMGVASDMIDACLVRQAQTGDQQAIADLLRLTRPIAERAVVRQFGDYQSADDLSQTSLLVVLTGLHSLRAPEAYVGWVQGIARNICRKEVRRKESVREAAMRLAQHSITSPTSMIDPLEEAVRLEVRAHLERALGCLQWRYRVVVIMRAVEGRSYDEIGVALDVPTHLARLWYFRARRRLQDTCSSDDVLVRAPSRPSSECVVEFPRNRAGRADHRPPMRPAAVEIASSAAS